MFTFEKGDYKFVFEYETMEELREGVQLAKETYEQLHQNSDANTFDKTLQLFEYIHKGKDSFANLPANKDIAELNENLTFEELEVRFLSAKKKAEKVGEASYKAYSAAFDKLKRYFRQMPINSLTIHNFEKHRDSLIGHISNTTINNHMIYVNMFLDFAETYGWVEKNRAKGIETLKVEKVEKDNFTDEEIGIILKAEKPEGYKELFEIAIYTGMRINEIIKLKPESVCEENGIIYYDVGKSKTKAGVRKVPLHPKLIEKGYSNPKIYPVLGDKTVNAGNKGALRVLYKILDYAQEQKKGFHTLRGTVVNRLDNLFPDKIHVIQEIVGHSKGDKSLTVDTYGKGFDLKLKKEIVDRISYLNYNL